MMLQQEWALCREQVTARRMTAAGGCWEYLVGPGREDRAIVLLPGGLNSAEAFFPLIAGLGRAARVIAVRYPTIDSIATLIDGLLALLDAEGVSKAQVLGTSLGGAVAQCLVRQVPGRVEALVLSNTFAPNRAARRRLHRGERAVAWLPWAILRRLTERRVLGLAAALPPPEQAFGRRFLAACLATTDTRRWLISQYRLLADYCEHYRFAPGDVSGWAGRTLIVRSEDDPMVARLTGRPLADYYPGAAIHTFRAGHLPLLTAREEYRRVVVPFLLSAR